MEKRVVLKASKMLMMVCALVLVFGAVGVVGGADVKAASILDVNVTYEVGEGPKTSDVTLPGDETWDPGSVQKLPAAPACKDSNFVFREWLEIKEGDVVGKSYAAGETYTVATGDSRPLTFRAVWGVKVTYDKNLDDATENISVPAETSAPYKTDFAIDEQLQANSYTFLGWSTEAKKDAVEPEYKYGDVIKGDSMTSALKLYAIWKPNFLRVTYHANTGNDQTDSTVTVPVDSTKYVGENLTVTIMGDGKLATNNANAATMKDAVPVRSGYTFAGWATSASSKTVEYKPGSKIDPITKDTDLYAVWTSSTATASNSSTSSGTTSTSKTPQTGDNDYLILYIVMAVLSLVGIIYLCYDQKKGKATK